MAGKKHEIMQIQWLETDVLGRKSNRKIWKESERFEFQK